MRKKRLLFVDDDEVYLGNSKRLIEAQGGYRVYTASNLVIAQELLASRYVHLATFDVFMADNDSTRRISGLTLVHDPAYADLVKLVVTGKLKDSEDVAAALRPIPGRRLPPAVDYVNKTEEGDWRELLRQIEANIDKFCGINWELMIDHDPLGPAYDIDLVKRLEPDLPREEEHERADELVDLLRMAFADYDRVRLDRRLWQNGARLALAVTAWREQDTHDRLVIIGLQPAVIDVAEHRRRLMPPRAPRGHAQPVALSRPPRTLRYAAEVYELPDARLDQLRTLRQFYIDSSSNGARECVAKLLTSGLHPLGSRSTLAADADPADALLRAHAGLTAAAPDGLRQAIQSAGAAAERERLASLRLAGGRLLIRSSNGQHYDLPDPAAWLATPGPDDFERPLCLGDSCGAPPPDTILVASDGRSWLTDYGHLGRGPLLSGLAALEARVVFDLHLFASPEQFADAQRQLLRPTMLVPTPDAPTTELRKPFAVIDKIRRQAAQDDYGGDIHAYYRALFYHAAQRLLTTPADDYRGAMTALCACLTLGLIAERLGETIVDPPPLVHPGLYIDEPSQRVFLDGRLIKPPLMPTAYQFLLYLYQHDRCTCPNTEIMKNGLRQERYHPNSPARLASVIRLALGPTAGNYLQVRDGGYIVFRDGKPDTLPDSPLR